MTDPEHAPIVCANTSCGRAWGGEVRFCPYCGTPHTPKAEAPSRPPSVEPPPAAALPTELQPAAPAPAEPPPAEPPTAEPPPAGPPPAEPPPAPHGGKPAVDVRRNPDLPPQGKSTTGGRGRGRRLLRSLIVAGLVGAALYEWQFASHTTNNALPPPTTSVAPTAPPVHHTARYRRERVLRRESATRPTPPAQPSMAHVLPAPSAPETFAPAQTAPAQFTPAQTAPAHAPAQTAPAHARATHTTAPPEPAQSTAQKTRNTLQRNLPNILQVLN